MGLCAQNDSRIQESTQAARVYRKAASLALLLTVKIVKVSGEKTPAHVMGAHAHEGARKTQAHGREFVRQLG